MLTGVVVSASSFLDVVVILYRFIFVVQKSIKIQSPALVGAGLILGLQLISKSYQKYIRTPFSWCHQLVFLLVLIIAVTNL